MQYYPVSLDINNRKCLVVGGGSVGTRVECDKCLEHCPHNIEISERMKDVAEELAKYKPEE